MADSPEREQAEALWERAEAALAITATRQSPLSVAWSNATVTQLAGDVVALAAAASRLVERAEKAERERDFAVDEQLAAQDELAAAVERERELTRALAAYRSALRCGEPETEKLRAVGDAALAGGVSAAGRPPEPDPASLSVTQGGIGDTAGFFLPPAQDLGGGAAGIERSPGVLPEETPSDSDHAR